MLRARGALLGAVLALCAAPIVAPLGVAGVAGATGITGTTGIAGAATARAGAPTKPLSTTGIAHWHLVGSSQQATVNASEGVATVDPPGGTPYVLYRGLSSVPSALSSQGWSHIGDPDSMRGYIIDAYQGPSSRPSKLFVVTTPSGKTIQYVHTLVKGEIYNNSFDAIAPGGQWMVAGEWNTMRHLQIYPTPFLNRRTSRNGGQLRLAGYIKLNHKVNNVQGCDFVTARMLICTSDDDSGKLFANQKPLLEITLSHRLQGRTVTGHVVDLGPIPQRSTCAGTFESEGVDYDVATGILRAEIIQPGSCILHTTVYEYKQNRG